jgi:hypothetical protein
MVSSQSPAAPYSSSVSSEGDWPAQVAGRVEEVVGLVRDKTTRPAQTIARAIVFGMSAAVLGIAVLVLAIITGIRLLDSYLPSAVFGDDHTWVAHLFVGLLFCAAGIVLWRMREGSAEVEPRHAASSTSRRRSGRH